MWKSACTAFMASPHQMCVSRHLQTTAALPPAKQSPLPTDPFTSIISICHGTCENAGKFFFCSKKNSSL